MKLKSIGRYLLPLIGLLILNLIYFYPAIQGKILEQDDIKLGHAKGKQIKEYRETEGEEPLWTQAMFSGMPTFQISTKYPNNWITKLQQAISWIGGRASNIYIVFTLMFGFYLIMLTMRVNPWLAAVGSLAFAFSAFFIISFGAGHNAKVRTAAYIAPVIMGILLTYRGKFLTGFALTALFLGLNINSNHFQVTYYLAIMIMVIAVVEFLYALKVKEQPKFWKASGLLIIAAILAIGPNVSKLWSTYEYTKETMRGGSSELSSMKQSEGGLTFDYAMNWSYGILETFNLIIPDVTGGGMAQEYEGTEIHDQYFENIVRSLQQRGVRRGQAEEQANQYLGSMFYWGEQSLVNGGYYIGAVVFFLFILGLFIVPGRIRNWVIAITILSVIMAWGKNFRAFNEFLFEYLPLYNKFRVPSYTFMMSFFAMPFLGFLAANQVLKGKYDKNRIKKQLLYSLYITGGICLFFIVLGRSMFEFVGPRDAQLAQQGIDLAILESDRVSVMTKSAFKTLLFCGLTFGVMWFYFKGKMSAKLLIGALAALVLIDQWSFVKQHVNANDFVSERVYENAFTPTPADQQILQDNDIHYRVYNTTAGLTSDSYTSYYHKSIGGYHGAKLIRYQDLIDHQLSKGNMSAFNMLNAKWFIFQNEGGPEQAQQNPNACGTAWFVNDIQIVPNADAEMAALSDFDPDSTAIVDVRFQDHIPKNISSSGSHITLSSYDPKHMVYEANVTSENAFAVFSEIYYEGGDEDWKSYINGEEVDHIRVNYLLRGMAIPKGNHKVEFKFKPASYYTGEKIALAFSIVTSLVLLSALILFYRRRKDAPDQV